MGKVTWTTSAADVDDYEGDGFYEGPVPPPSVYRMKVVEVLYKTFSTGSAGLRLTLDVDDPRAEKAQYKGARVWENIVDGEASLFRVKQFLNAIGASGKDWAKTVTDNDDKVTAIGKVKINDRLYIRAKTKYRTYNGEQQFEVAQFLPLGQDDDDDNDATDSTNDNDDPPF